MEIEGMEEQLAAKAISLLMETKLLHDKDVPVGMFFVCTNKHLILIYIQV